MTWKFVVTAALVCACVISTIAIFPGLVQELFQEKGMRSSLSEAPKRHIFDAKHHTIEHHANPLADQKSTLHYLSQSQSEPQQMTAITATTPSPEPAELPRTYNLDMPEMTMAFGTNDLNDLIAKGSTLIPLPGNTPIELRLVSVTERYGIEQIKAEHQGLVSTITRRGDKFFATVSSTSDSYRIEGGLHQAHVFPHRLLAQRTIRHQTDYRYVQ
jgi:hypothetical protein